MKKFVEKAKTLFEKFSEKVTARQSEAPVQSVSRAQVAVENLQQLNRRKGRRHG